MNFQLKQSAIAGIRELQRPGTPDILARLVTIYMDTTPALIADLNEGIATNDSDRIKMAAHALKSSSAYLGATSLADQCDKLEQSAANHDLSNAATYIDTITTGFAVVSGQIQKYC